MEEGREGGMDESRLFVFGFVCGCVCVWVWVWVCGCVCPNFVPFPINTKREGGGRK